MSSGPLAELSYEEAIRSLDVQERAVEQLRARTGVLLAASSFTASFFETETIQSTQQLGVLGMLAVISLAFSILACVYVLLPKRGFRFSVDAANLYETLYPVADDAHEMHRRLAYWLEGLWRVNQQKLKPLGQFFFAAALGLVLQFVFWTCAVSDTLP